MFSTHRSLIQADIYLNFIHYSLFSSDLFDLDAKPKFEWKLYTFQLRDQIVYLSCSYADISFLSFFFFSVVTYSYLFSLVLGFVKIWALVSSNFESSPHMDKRCYHIFPQTLSIGDVGSQCMLSC